MQNPNITNILDKLEDKLKVERIAKRLIEFRTKAIVGWLSRMDKKVFSNRQEYSDKVDKDVEVCAKNILEVINDNKS